MLGSILKNTWPLFLGLGFLMLGNGLQSTLVSWRATYEGFSSTMTGLVMAGYYAGFLAGSVSTPNLIQRVGYIRVFAALASLASTAVLVMIIYINPWAWLTMRFMIGFCFAGTYVIVESWLNARSDNENRGSTLSFYMVVSYGGLAAGQWLLNTSDPAGVTLFLVSSILLSLALVPVLISRTEAPAIEDSESLGVASLFRIAPSGVFSIIATAIAHSAMFGMGAVYAASVGMTISETVLFMSTYIVAGAFMQLPLGWVSDRIDRRLVILGLSLIVILSCYVLFKMEPQQTQFVLMYALLGGMTLPLYSIGVAHTNDRLKPEQMISASSTVVLIFGSASILGPVIAGYLLDTVGSTGYFLHIGAAHAILAVGMLYFISQREAVAQDEQIQYQSVPDRPTAVILETVAYESEDSLEPEQNNNEDE